MFVNVIETDGKRETSTAAAADVFGELVGLTPASIVRNGELKQPVTISCRVCMHGCARACMFGFLRMRAYACVRASVYVHPIALIPLCLALSHEQSAADTARLLTRVQESSPYFDARSIGFRTAAEVAQHVVWRSAVDCQRNSTSALHKAVFGDKDTMGRKGGEMRRRLNDKAGPG